MLEAAYCALRDSLVESKRSFKVRLLMIVYYVLKNSLVHSKRSFKVVDGRLLRIKGLLST